MTREEQIREAIDKIFPCTNGGRCYEQSIGASGFELGVQWADNHPKQGTVDLLQVWHLAEEEPCPYKDILTENQKGSYVVRSWYNEGFGWKSYAKIFQLKRWAYIDDLLPKKK